MAEGSIESKGAINLVLSSTPRMLQELLADPSVTQLSDEQITLEDLLVYVETEVEGQDASRLHPQVQAALDNSPAWRQEYTEIKEFLCLEESDNWRGPTRAPRFDFSYLPALDAEGTQSPATTYEPSWYWKKVRHLVIEFSAELLESLRAPQPQLAYTFERSNQAPAGRYQFALANTDEGLTIRLNVQCDHQTSDRYQMVVETEIPSRGGWPHLANTTVNLKQADTVVQTRLTDAFGKAVFEAIAATDLAQMQVEIIADEQGDLGRQSG